MQPRANQTLNFAGGDSDWTLVRAARIFDGSLGNVIPIPFTVLNRMCWGKPVATLVVNETDQQAWRGRPRAVPVSVIVGSQLCLHSLPKFTRDNPFMLARVDLPSVLNFPQVDS